MIHVQVALPVRMGEYGPTKYTKDKNNILYKSALRHHQLKAGHDVDFDGLL